MITKQIGRKTYKIHNNRKVCIRCMGKGQVLMIDREGIHNTDCPHCRGTNGITKAYAMGIKAKGEQ